MRRAIVLAASMLWPIAATAQLANPAPVDMSGVATKGEAAAAKAAADSALAQLVTISTQAATGAAAAPFARVKWAGERLQTDATGVRVIVVPPGRMSSGLSVSGIVVRTPGQFPVPTVAATGSPAAGYTVTVTFTRARSQVTIPAVVLGAAAVILPLVEPQASTGVVTFDIGFSEPDVTGP